MSAHTNVDTNVNMRTHIDTAVAMCVSSDVYGDERDVHRNAYRHVDRHAGPRSSRLRTELTRKNSWRMCVGMCVDKRTGMSACVSTNRPMHTCTHISKYMPNIGLNAYLRPGLITCLQFY